MATVCLPRRPGEQSIGNEAEVIPGAGESSTVNAELDGTISKESRNPLGASKGLSRSSNSKTFSRPRARSRAEEQRSGTAGRFSQSGSQSRMEAAEPKAQLSRSRSCRSSKFEESAKDLADLPPPHSPRLDCIKVHSDASMIGLALGSPSQLQPTHSGWLGQSPLANMETEVLSSKDDYREGHTCKPKTAKWKKIGGFFRAKNAIPKEPAPSPFYQLQPQYAAQVSDRSDSSFHSRTADLAPRNQALSSGLPLLDVKIPDVQMERYSVMFGNVLDKQEPPSLLSRRDKTLRSLVIDSDRDQKPSKIVHGSKQLSEVSETRPNNTNHAYLTPEACGTYPRRATSPTTSKSPSFSLFPQRSQAAGKVVGHITAGKESPRQRSFTSPARLSPMQKTFNPNEKLLQIAEDLKTDCPVAASSSQPTSTLAPEKDSHDPSVHPPTPAWSSIVEEALVDTKSQGLLKRQGQSEAMSDQSLIVPPLKPRNFAIEAHNQLGIGREVGTGTKEPTRVNTHEDTLAALERPKSITLESKNAASSLNPSKSRIDQIMGGAPSHQTPDPPANVRNMPVSPEKPQFEKIRELPSNREGDPKSQPSVTSGTRQLATSPASAAAVTAKEEQPVVKTNKEGTGTKSSHIRPKDDIEAQSVERSTGTSQQPPRGHGQPSPLRRHPSDATQPAIRDNQKDFDFLTRQPPQTSQPDKGSPQLDVGRVQSRPPVSDTSHRQNPSANALPLTRPTLNATNRSFPVYRPSPQNPGTHPHIPSTHVSPQPRPSAHSTATPLPGKEQDNIFGYYLDTTAAKSFFEPTKRPKKLQKRPSHKSEKDLWLSSSTLAPPKPRLESSHSSETVPRSPVPVSQYSTNVPVIQKPVTQNPVISPPNTSFKHSPLQFHSQSLAPSELDLVDPHLVSQDVHVAHDEPTEILQASCVNYLTTPRTGSTPISKPPRRPPRAEISFVVDAPDVVATRNKTSFYYHSNTSTLSLAEPHEGSGLEFAEQRETAPGLRRPSSSGACQASLPSTTDGVEPRLTMSKVAAPARFVSADTVGSGTGVGIQGHLKPERGEKVVERLAGLVPTLVEQETRHRAGKSVNLVIESV